MKKNYREYEYQESEDQYEMACEWIDQGEFEKAVTCLEKAIERNPLFVYAYVTLAETYEKLNKPQDAIVSLKRAFKQDPDFDRLPFLIARLYFSIGDYKLSLKFIDTALEMAYMPEYEELKELVEKERKKN